MPVIHKYKGKNEHYVLTSISGNIITFQLTDEGHKKLLDIGLKDGDRFERALLFDLYRSGEAFTYGAGPGKLQEVDKRQLVLDFPDDPEPESIFPSCSVCSSIDDLHFVEIHDKEHFSSIYCSECRKIRSATVNTSIPLPLLNRGLLNRVLEMNKIKKLDKSITTYQEQLNAEFSSRWEEIAEIKKTKQSKKQDKLFEFEDDQGKLL